MDISRVENVMDKCIREHGEVGAAYVLTKDGEKTASYSAGFADIAGGKPMKTDTICRAFSCTKVATSTAAMMLMERGLLDIDYCLEWFIPEFSNPVYIRNGKEIKCSRSIKIRDLLNMTSGIAYPGDWHEGVDASNTLWWETDQNIKNNKSFTTQEFAARAGKCPLMFDVGAEWMYGGSADVLGAVIEKISGQKLSDFMRENIFEPLEMKDTAFYVPKEKADRFGPLYEYAGENPKIFTGVNLCIYDVNTPPKFESAGAGLFSTADDYSKLGAMLSNGGIYGEKRILGRKAIDFMHTNGLTAEEKKTFTWDSTRGCGYANLVRMIENTNECGLLISKGSFGWDGWTGTYLICDPTEKVSITLFVQRAGAGTTQLARNVVNSSF